MARLLDLHRIWSGASLLALVAGIVTANAQTPDLDGPALKVLAQGQIASPLADLRGATSPTDAVFAEPVEDAAPESGPSRERDGDIPGILEPPAVEAEPADPDAAPISDGDLTADGQADAIAEPPDADSPEADATGVTDADLDMTANQDEPASGAPPLPGVPEPNADGAGLPAVEPSFRPSYDEAEDNPYAPLGLRIGSFLVFPEITAEETFDDNVLRSETGRISDRVLGLKGALRIVSDWNRHSLEANLAGLRSYHQKLDSEDDKTIDAALRGRLDVSSDTILDGNLSYQLFQESRGTIDFPDLASGRPDVTERSASLALTQRFNRLAIRLRGAVDDHRRSAEGLDASEDYLEKALGLRIGYEMSPGLYLFAEQELSRRDYAAPAADDGLLRDADGRTTRVGVAAEITAKIVGELSVGKLVETPDADALAPIEGLVADGSLTWTPSALTTVSLGFRSSIAPTTIAGSAGALERAADLEVRHEFRRYFAAIAGLGYTTRDYAGTSIEEDELTGGLGLEYLIGRDWVLSAAYQRTEFWSSEAGGDYSDNLFRISGTLRR
ncbi:MAG: outer membrane beta-barrel protein [Hyphomicrobiaceae bacterium]